MNMTISNFPKNGYLSPRRIDLFNEVSRELDHAMNNIFGHDFFAGLSKKNRGYPLMDAIRTENELVLQFTVPGVDSNDLNVEITEDEGGNVLSVSGLLSDNYVSSENNYQIRELSSQEFRRLVRLPKDVDSEKPNTFLKDGILTIKFPCYSQKQTNNKVKKINIVKK